MSDSASPSSRPILTVAGRSVRAGILSDGLTWAHLDRWGSGCSVAGSHLLTAWAADPHGDPGGIAVHVRDRDRGGWWTIGRGSESESARAGADPPQPCALWSSPGRLRLVDQAGGIDAEMEVWIDPGTGAEVRRVTLRNPGSMPRSLELTTFVETVLHAPAAHASHPTFSKLFLQTEWVAGTSEGGVGGALLVRRRPRGSGESFPTLVHALISSEVTEHESDRARFFGRGRSVRSPRALATREELSGTTGNVLDPALCLRTHFELGPGRAQSIVLVLGSASDRERALRLVQGLASPEAQDAGCARASEIEVERRREAGLPEAGAELLQEFWSAMLSGNPSVRASAEVRARAKGSAHEVRALGIVDPAWTVVFPIGLQSLPSVAEDARRAHRYARSLGLPLETVLIVPSVDENVLRERTGTRGLHVFAAGELGAARCMLLEALAGGVAGEGWVREAAPPTERIHVRTVSAGERVLPATSQRALRFAHAHGGFAEDGRSYVVRMSMRDDGSWTRPPRPWVNVIANENFGSIVSESGAMSTWSRNSREHRLTPWMNDPVLDPHAEALYLQDVPSGRFWSPLPGPVPDGDRYEMEHGFGHSVCRHGSEGIEQTTTIFVPIDAPVQIVTLHLRNLEARPRSLALIDHRRLVLGAETNTGGRTVQTDLDPERRVLLGRNLLGGEFADGIAFATVVTACEGTEWSSSGDRGEFLGHRGSAESPAHLFVGGALSGRCGADLDAAFTQRLTFGLSAHGEAVIHLLFGEVVGNDELGALLARFADPAAIEESLLRVREAWSDRLGAVQVSTPSPGLDLMLNGWLAYQTVVCRLWARSAFYQSGGAYGFRDQLQDAVALVGTWPELAREQILRNAAHQFVEGDVLHWWHPPHSRGLRTRFADDLLWLPHLTAHYVRVTGDHTILDEPARFLRARELQPGEDEVFLQPELTDVEASVYEHGCRAIDRSLATGAHDLPLFGTGDWNDGMNRVGREGRGESVWMGFFLHTILGEWTPLCESRGDTERVHRYRVHRERLGRALEDGGWDGHWYRRGYYDDGTPLGSAESDECRIDALVQAWSVISGAVSGERAREAMEAVATHLVDEQAGIVRLLAPPFVETPHDPGYIKGYVAGVRENGGQYTHAALWVVRAFAELGQHDRAVRLLERIGPVHHTRSDAHVDRYQVEPYVVAADVYGVPPHVGRGGWTWYTGSAGWMSRVGLETVLGIGVEEGRWLCVAPRIPDTWPGFHARYRPFGRSTTYEIEVVNPEAAAQDVVAVRLDGMPLRPSDGRARVELAHDGRIHRLEVVLGRRAPVTQRARAAEVEN